MQRGGSSCHGDYALDCHSEEANLKVRVPVFRSTPLWIASLLPVASILKRTRSGVCLDGGARVQVPRPSLLSCTSTGDGLTGARREAFRHLAGHLAVHAGVSVFLPDYRLAPEYPFPAAPEDIRACYFGLVERGYSKIAITGDSAGGNLALGLLAYLARKSEAASDALGGWSGNLARHGSGPIGSKLASRALADPLFYKAAGSRAGSSLPGTPECMRSDGFATLC